MCMCVCVRSGRVYVYPYTEGEFGHWRGFGGDVSFDPNRPSRPLMLEGMGGDHQTGFPTERNQCRKPISCVLCVVMCVTSVCTCSSDGSMKVLMMAVAVSSMTVCTR